MYRRPECETPSATVPRIGTLPGYHVEVRAYVDVPERDGKHTDVIVSLEPQGPVRSDKDEGGTQ
ncbi:hypothetical protein [Paraburkholderia tagetis]|uniref:Uncharacterized protein n=1 Tax=Paraburkholderia tagetis TaxID=2913261 RepID=A0A9X1RSD9_9BURK|nr:hypothetical protein [Paraburkholderia tagetis]MCG5075132.1 hypothetical protein [Paraburkholderia tagetis]